MTPARLSRLRRVRIDPANGEASEAGRTGTRSAMRRSIGESADGFRRSTDGQERARTDGGSGVDPDVAAAFERRLQGLVEWGVDNGVTFDRSWTIRVPDGPDDVMVEFVYLEDDGE